MPAQTVHNSCEYREDINLFQANTNYQLLAQPSDCYKEARDATSPTQSLSNDEELLEQTERNPVDLNIEQQQQDETLSLKQPTLKQMTLIVQLQADRIVAGDYYHSNTGVQLNDQLTEETRWQNEQFLNH